MVLIQINMEIICSPFSKPSMEYIIFITLFFIIGVILVTIIDSIYNLIVGKYQMKQEFWDDFWIGNKIFKNYKKLK